MSKKIDIILIISVLFLLIMGTLAIYSGSVDVNNEIKSNEYIRQIIFIVLGIGLFLSMHLISLKDIRKYVIAYYIVCIVFLIITLLFGQIRNGAKSWIGIWNFGIQISEFSKISVVLLLAKIAEDVEKSHFGIRYIIYSLLFVCFPFSLVLLQPDMGTALVYIPILLSILFVFGVQWYRIMFVVFVGIISIVTLILLFFFFSSDISSINSEYIIAQSKSMMIVYIIILLSLVLISLIGINLSHFKRFFSVSLYISTLLSVGTLLTMLALRVLKPYQLQRLLIFINPDSDPLNTGWHILQSKNAIGSGGLWGLGFLSGNQSKLQYLPMAQTDFIFSVIGEEFGFIGSSLILLAYACIMWRILIIGYNSSSIFSAICCSGIFAIFFTHFTVNIGMTLGIMPVTGIPLMLLSYGGSALWTALICLGIVHIIFLQETKNQRFIKFQ